MADFNEKSQDYIFDDEMEEISSSSRKSVSQAVTQANINYQKGSIKNIAKIIKGISIFIAIVITIITFLAAAVLVYLDMKFFLPFAIGILVVGIGIALITMYIIYGIGHIISQNEEILRRL